MKRNGIRSSKRWNDKTPIRKIIISHQNPDFDSFASAVAIKAMEPDYEIVLCGEPIQNLKEFLHLYQERLPFYMDTEIHPQAVEEVVLVDVSVFARTGPILSRVFDNPSLRIRVYDHHPNVTPPDREIESYTVREIGSTTTLIVQMLAEKRVPLDYVQSTLCAIGIYEDTGNFLFSSTTKEDLEAAAWLLSQKANLDVVSAFVKTDMTIDQKLLMEELIKNVVIRQIEGTPIAVATHETEKFMGGLNLIVSKIWMHQGYDTFIGVIRMGRKVYIVGRTMSEDVNLGEMMGALRGGGHQKAAACKLNDVSLDEAVETLWSILPTYIRPSVKIKDIMSAPVKTVYAEMEIREAHKILELTGFGGLPVISVNQLVGVVVRRDIQKAMNHGMGNEPVRKIMSTHLVVVEEQDSLEKARQLMIDHGVGRLPVIRKGILVGFVTRSDIIRGVYKIDERALITESEMVSPYNVKSLLIRALSRDTYEKILRLGKQADEMGTKLFVVGGFVRDLLIGYPNQDVDLVVENNAIEFAQKVVRQEKAQMDCHEKFMTAKIHWEDGSSMDIATARIEYYRFPGALPEVELAPIKKDLYRRDFTINALAISLNQGTFGNLLDFFHCRKDIEEGIIQVLYNLSFVEDPTRIIRAIRYSERYQFQILPRTLELLKEALDNQYLEKISKNRIREEIVLCLKEPNRSRMIQRMGELDVFRHIFGSVYFNPSMSTRIDQFFQFLPWIETFTRKGFHPFYALLHVLLEYLPFDELSEIIRAFGIPKKVGNSIAQLSDKAMTIAEVVRLEMAFSDIYFVMEGITAEGIAFIASYLDAGGQEYLKEYLRTRKNTRIEYVTASILIKKHHVEDADAIKKIIQRVVGERLDGRCQTAEDEKKLLDQWFESHQDHIPSQKEGAL